MYVLQQKHPNTYNEIHVDGEHFPERGANHLVISALSGMAQDFDF